MRSRAIVFLVILCLAAPLFAASNPAAKGPVSAMILVDGLQPEAAMSYSFGVSNPSTGSTGGGGGAGKVVLSDFHFTKNFNSQSAQFFKKCATGEHIKTVTINLVDGSGKVVAGIKLSDVLVSSYQTGGGGGADISDQVSLNFAEIDFVRILIGL